MQNYLVLYHAAFFIPADEGPRTKMLMSWQRYCSLYHGISVMTIVSSLNPIGECIYITRPSSNFFPKRGPGDEAFIIIVIYKIRDQIYS